MKFELTLAHSRWIDIALGLAHGFAALMVAVTPFLFLLKLAAISALGLSLFYYLRRNRQRVQIEISEDNFCLLRIDDAAPIECRISPRSFVAGYLVILTLEGSGIFKYVIIAPDRLDADTFRRLRVFLRWRICFAANVG